MKKRSTVLIYLLLILLLPLWAEIQQDKVIPVEWNLIAIEGYASISFVTPDNTDPKTVDLTESISSDGAALTGGASVKLEWDVISSLSVEIVLSANGPLSADGIEKTLPWSLSIGALTEDSVMTISSDLSFENWDYGKKAIMSYDPYAVGIGDRGSVEIDITAGDASYAIPAKYSATLTAEIKAK